MSLHDEITKAIGVHGMWKTRLSSAIDAGKSEFSVDQVAKDNACDFGKWIYGPTVPPDAKKMAEYETCRHLHADFHKAAADVLRLAISGDKAKARAGIAANSKFAEISGKLTLAMMKWAGIAH
jgi:methyl-accepting chemotaxis protein